MKNIEIFTLEVIQSRGKWHHSKAWFPIRIP